MMGLRAVVRTDRTESVMAMTVYILASRVDVDVSLVMYWISGLVLFAVTSVCHCYIHSVTLLRFSEHALWNTIL